LSSQLNFNCYQVELHVHLDGAVRPETAWELAKLKNLELPGKNFNNILPQLFCTKLLFSD